MTGLDSVKRLRIVPDIYPGLRYCILMYHVVSMSRVSRDAFLIYARPICESKARREEYRIEVTPTLNIYGGRGRIIFE